MYSVANKFSSVYITFYNVFNLSWTESVSLHLLDNDGEDFIEDTLNTLFRIFSCLCVLMIVFMPFIFPIMINKQYFDAYYQIPILMIAVLFQVVVGLYSAIYVALKKSVEIAKTSFGAAIINLVVDIVLIKLIGLYAASISTLVAYMVMAIYRYYDLKKYVTIILDKKIIADTIIIFTTSLISYYLNIFALNILILVIAIVYSIMINKSFLKSICRTIMIKIKNK